MRISRTAISCAPTALLHDRDRAADLAERLEVANEQDRIRQITHVDRRGDVFPDEAVLGKRQNR